MIWLLYYLAGEVLGKEPAVDTAAEMSRLIRRPPKGFVDVKAAIPTIEINIRYHSDDNFTGAPLPGYGVSMAWLLSEPTKALQRVQEELSWDGLGLLIYDAYRPRRASEAMVAWATRTNQTHLLDQGYIAAKSGHNHGHTIDVTLVDLKTKTPLDMGTSWDTFDETAHVSHATGIVLENRMKLQQVMTKYGFRGYSKEWWHFRYPMVGTSARDVPYGCFEEREWHFQPPTDWNKPTYQPPKLEERDISTLECVSQF